jgi:hypothetical protein
MCWQTRVGGRTATVGKAGHGIKENYFFNSLTFGFRTASSSWFHVVPVTDTSFGTRVTKRHSMWYCSHLQTFLVVLQSARHYMWCYSHSQTFPVTLSHLQTQPVVLVTCRHNLWYYSHLQTLPVVLKSLADTSCGTTVTCRHSLWY